MVKEKERMVYARDYGYSTGKGQQPRVWRLPLGLRKMVYSLWRSAGRSGAEMGKHRKTKEALEMIMNGMSHQTSTLRSWWLLSLTLLD